MLKLESLVIGILLSAVLSAASCQELASASKFNKHRSSQMKNFTPVKVSLSITLSATDIRKKAAVNTYWTTCGGSDTFGYCRNSCMRVTNSAPGHVGQSWCVSCSSCGPDCTNDYDDLPC